MCKAMEDYTKRQRITGMIQGMQMMGASENDIINKSLSERFRQY